MWRKYLARDDVRAVCSARATVFKFAAGHRRAQSSLERAAELASFAASIGSSEARDGYRVSATFGRGLCFQLHKAGAAHADSFEEALAMAYLSEDREAAEWAVDGEHMALRLWPRQRGYLEMIWHVIRALEIGHSASIEAVHGAEFRDPDGTRRLVSAVCKHTGREESAADGILKP